MDHAAPDPLRDAAWRRKLTPAELAQLQARVKTSPEPAQDWEAELALTEALEKLAPVPVSSNFNARVLEKIHLEDRAQARPARPASPWWSWLVSPRWAAGLAFGCALLLGGTLTYRQFSPAAKVADGLAAVSEVGAVPSPEILQDFDAIRVMTASPGADEELLALMQ